MVVVVVLALRLRWPQLHALQEEENHWDYLSQVSRQGKLQNYKHINKLCVNWLETAQKSMLLLRDTI